MDRKPGVEDLAWRFVDLFVDEARDHLRGAREQAAAWAQSADPAAAEAFRRHAHSLKGMAGTMGLVSMVREAKTLESHGLASLDPAELLRALAAIQEVVEAVARGEHP